MSRGHDRERKVRRWLEERDYWVGRIAGSLGDVDLVATKLGERLMIEVKSTAKGPFEHFGPSDRDDLKAAAELADMTPVLCWWPPYKREPIWLYENDWPLNRERKAA